MKWFIAILLVAAFITLLALAPDGTPRAVLIGWFEFLRRVIPNVTLDQRSTLFAAGAILLFAVGVHFTGRWWRRHLQATQGNDIKPWRLRWTLLAVAVVFLTFTAGIAMVGITHQTGWLASSPEPLVVTTPKRRFTADAEWNLRYMGLGFHHHQSDFGFLPRAGTFDDDGNMLHSWETQLLPYIGYMTREIDLKLPWNHPKNTVPFHKPVLEFLNPDLRSAPYRDTDGYCLSHYAVNSHVLAGNKKMTLAEITDGTANTILVGEINANFPPWGHPVNWRDPTKGLNRVPDGFGGPPSRNGVTFVMADGSVRFLHNRTAPEVLKALSTPAAGDKVESPVD
jgi:uncharacterized protein DUF1559